MKHRHVIILILIVAAGCGDSRGKDCQKALDWQLEQAPKNIEKAAGASENRAEIQAQGAKEIQAMRDKFVDVCKKADKFDSACYIDQAKSKTEDCRKMTRAIDEQVMGSVPAK